MIEPIGVAQESVITSLGTMVYYTPTLEPWTEEGESHPKPTLLFLHGFGGGSSAYEWSKVYPAFASDYRVIAPDLIGWGRSEHPKRNYQANDYITTIIEFIEKTCHNEKALVIASSLTAAFTIRAAILRPDLFSALILTTPAGLSDFGEDYSRSFFAQLVSIPVLDQLIYNSGVATANGILSFLQNRQFAHPERVYPEIVEAYLKSAQQPNAQDAALSFVRGDLCFDLSLYITQLTIPTAIIWGKKSQFTGPEIGKRLAAMNPESIKIFLEIDDVGLTPQLELPAVTIGLIRKYLKILI
ncbi:alpha/beta hydrolase [Aphanothece hegewaldii CCALA 016]|uniref:Alpha/beta hydrolase n=1 Tax=Aphanothece hegewaldii CCALA 016 TaxID=2107694 RepID=A0A2T1LZN4_9CHRO|nr:alpha/beta hydrolase [Aphanothece hegewaldii]PSF37884.1 alpha/beta hydrolase [Aphanothece hegewaldii CCALA 016]